MWLKKVGLPQSGQMMFNLLIGIFSLTATEPGHDQLRLGRLRTGHFSPWNRTA